MWCFLFMHFAAGVSRNYTWSFKACTGSTWGDLFLPNCTGPLGKQRHGITWVTSCFCSWLNKKGFFKKIFVFSKKRWKIWIILVHDQIHLLYLKMFLKKEKSITGESPVVAHQFTPTLTGNLPKRNNRQTTLKRWCCLWKCIAQIIVLVPSLFEQWWII